MTPIDILMNQVKFTCVCCGAESDCECHKPYMDKCKSKCLLHCKCRDCKKNRNVGLWRINWAGLHHIYFKVDTKTLCGKKLPAPHLGTVTAPTNGLRGTECKVCQRKLRQLAQPENVGMFV